MKNCRRSPSQRKQSSFYFCPSAKNELVQYWNVARKLATGVACKEGTSLLAMWKSCRFSSRNYSLLWNRIIDLAGVQEGSLFLGPEVSNLVKRYSDLHYSFSPKKYSKVKQHESYFGLMPREGSHLRGMEIPCPDLRASLPVKCVIGTVINCSIWVMILIWP